MIVPTFASALPKVLQLQDCADYGNTFESFLPQLYALPAALVPALTNLDALKSLYLSTNPAISGLAFSIALMPIFLVTSEINRNWSQVDRMWSLLPTIYHVHLYVWARATGLSDERLLRVAIASIFWSIRLTFNYWRRGGYNIGSEDYRWALIKGKIGNFAFFLLNIAFISTVQSVLLWSVSNPAYLTLVASKVQPSATIVDNFMCAVIIALVIVEFVADGQMWNYQSAKQKYKETAKVVDGYTRAQLDRGFITNGLWAYSRHPNFAAEQSIWLIFYLWGCQNTDTLYNWTLAGVVAYWAIFAGSTPLTERITAGKYPEYKEYQARVGCFVPSLFGGGWNETEAEKREAAKSK